LGDRFPVQVEALALVGHRAIPGKSECFKRAEDCISRAWHSARAIQVFHAQQPAAAPVAGVEETCCGGRKRPQMQLAGR
jgi:hypothetical protein